MRLHSSACYAAPTGARGSCVFPLAPGSVTRASRTRQPDGTAGFSFNRAAQHALHNPWMQHTKDCHRLLVCKAKFSPSDGADVKEKHKVFDEAVIVVKSGAGGNGEVVEAGRGKWVKNLKYHAGGNSPKKMWLPASDPADGADGADVVLVCDPQYDSLLHLHKRCEYVAPRGSNANPAVGSSGPKNNRGIKKAMTAPLEIPVPPGTLVQRKRSGEVLGELLRPGQRLLVAAGGRGGLGATMPSQEVRQQRQHKEARAAAAAGGELIVVDDVNWKDDAKGLPGVEMSLKLLLRVVADVGIVGFPNAGKSSLLKALTRASPAVAPYPFTTLMPNLGVMAAGQGPVLADLPGLIEGAHVGKGLGRMFLRHLRRTRVLLHVVDASAADPATDYLAVREELRMYNPDYCSRRHVVALNKMDLEEASALAQEVEGEVAAAAANLQEQHPGVMLPPCAIVACSAATGDGLEELAAALQSALGVKRKTAEERAAAAWLEQDEAAVAAAAAELGHRLALSELAMNGSSSGGGGAAGTTTGADQPTAAAESDDLDDNFDDVLGHQAGAPAHLAWSSVEEGEGTIAGDGAREPAAQQQQQQEASDDEDEGDYYEEEEEELLEEGQLGEDDEEDEEEEGEEEPAPLDPNDPDAWLLGLTEEELLNLEID